MRHCRPAFKLGAALMCVWALGLAMISWAGPLRAEQPAPDLPDVSVPNPPEPNPPVPVLSVPCPGVAPYCSQTPEGVFRGYFVDLARLIGREIGHEVRFVPTTPPEALRGLSEGRFHMIPGIPSVRSLEGKTVRSDPVGKDVLQVFARRDTVARLSRHSMTGLRIGIVERASAANLTGILARNHPVPRDTPLQNLTDLLAGEVDVIVGTHLTYSRVAAKHGVDHIIVPTGPPVRDVSRHVLLHTSAAGLLPGVNAAIERLVASGEMSAVQQRWQVVLPEPPPDVLTVGVYHAPPFQVVTEDGSVTGFSVEALRVLAKKIGLDLRFEVTSAEDASARVRAGHIDMLAYVDIQEGTRGDVDVTLPVLRSDLAYFTRKAGPDDSVNVDTLAHRRIGVMKGSLAEQLVVPRHNGGGTVMFADREQMVRALEDGELDGVADERFAFFGAVEDLGLGGAFGEHHAQVLHASLAFGLRSGLASVRESLNAIIPTYVLSEDYTFLRTRWLEPPVFWTPNRRQSLAIFGAAVALTALILALLAQGAARRRTWREKRRFAASILDKLPVHTILIGRTGLVDFVDAETKAQLSDDAHTFKTGRSYREQIVTALRRGLISDEEHEVSSLETIFCEHALRDGFEFEHRGHDGSVRKYFGRRLRDGSHLLLSHDTTQDHAQIQQVLDLNEELAHQIRLVNDGKSALLQFAYASSHDLKAPLNTALMLLDALEEELRDGPPPGAQDTATDEYLGDLKQSLRRMQRLIDDVLNYAGSVDQPGDFADTSLEAMVEEVLSLMAPDLQQCGAVVHRDALPSVDAHPEQMRQLLTNLIDNAVKYRDPARPLIVHVRHVSTTSESVTFEVADNGIGIPQAYQERVFRLFERAHTDTLARGSGIGLALCQRIVLNHGGCVTVRSTVGEGTCFRVTLRRFQAKHQTVVRVSA